MEMSDTFFSFEPYDYGRVHDVHVSLKKSENDGVLNKGEETQLFGSEDWGDLDFICSQYASYEDSIPRKEVILSDEEDHHQQQPFSDFGMLDDFQFYIDSPTFQAPEESVTLDSVLTELSDFVKPKNERQYPTTLGSLELLNGYKSGYNKMNVEKINENHQEPCKVVDNQRLSTEEVMRVAGAQYIQFSVRNDNHLSMLSHPFGCAFSGLGNEETNEVELAHLLLASAEKIGNQQYDRASKLLTQCASLSSSTGSPVQRVSYYFAEALQERLNRETGRISFKGGKKGKQRMQFGVSVDYEEGQMTPSSALLECHQKLPFCQVLQFPGVQAIVESVALARKVHFVDLGIQTGIAWTLLMQALAARHECPVELFKLTAVGTDEQETQETGRRLANFAESMGIPFSFKPIILSNMADLKEELFDITEDEAVAVYSPFVLRTMLTQSERLDSLMRVIRNLNPCIMVVTEIEAYHNSPSFFNRFIECIFFFSAFFDCLDACMDRNNQNRITTEKSYFGKGIMNIVATEGEERIFRHVGIDVWRAFFARFGMVEMEFSQSSLYQANLIRKQFACGSLCTLDMNKKCLTVGWKGTPLHSLSVWKFH